jgi:hypothetical protein
MTHWKPWHHIVQVRDDVKTGDLSLSIFAANLYDVAMQHGHRPIYEQPEQFFALTYPTYNLRELAKDVITRLAGQSDKAVRQLELTYGGGKTHTLITLYHLVNNPAHLPDLPAVHEFTSHIGMTPPRARIAALTFDQIDVEKGMETRAPNGDTRWLKHPWSILAFQLAGATGLKRLHADGLDAERESAPAENLLTDLLSLPQQEGLATLILIDEVLMYAHEKVGLAPEWRGRISNFFQYLTQAIARVDRCAMVASLLASDVRKNDPFGRELAQEFFAIFRREREESVQPVSKDDVAEVLRRRFFTPDSIRDREAFRPHVVAAVKGIAMLDDQTERARKDAEERYLLSYPFHPDLTDVFYTKWTNMESFQRTRGILRTFAMAIRDAETWDTAPLIGANVLLATPSQQTLSDAARELAGTAASEEYEGKRHEWTSILEGELTRAQQIQQEYTGLHHREIEQAVMAVFLHSQPVGKRAQIRDLLLLLGATRPDKINLHQALLRWVGVSWFLDDETTEISDNTLPRSWRLGPEPNLTQMHHDACNRIVFDDIERVLEEQIGKIKWLTEGATAAGARVHTLPRSAADVEDNGEFRYVILGPNAASESGKPSAEARKFLDTTTGGNPRTYRNAIVLVAPSHIGLDVIRTNIRQFLGWKEVQHQLRDQELDPRRERTLKQSLEESHRKIPESIRQAYTIVITISEHNEAQAFKITPNNKTTLFAQIKNHERSRMQDTPVAADALLPGGPYNIWREDEPSRRVNDLVSIFAQFPNQPKMINTSAILDTLLEGCRAGMFVLRDVRSDRSSRTFWRSIPDQASLDRNTLEVVLPEHATLSDLAPSLLAPGQLPGLWNEPDPASPDLLPETTPVASFITVGKLCAYFAGGKTVSVEHEVIVIPKVERTTLETTVREAVEQGTLWITEGNTSLYRETVPDGILTDDTALRAPPSPISTPDVLPSALPSVWGEQDIVTAQAIADGLSAQANAPLPWGIVSTAIDGAFLAGFLERTEDAGPWPCDRAGAHQVRVRLPTLHYRETPSPATPSATVREAPHPRGHTASAILTIDELQNLADTASKLVTAAAACGIQFHLRIELGHDQPPTDEIIETVNTLLKEVASGLEVK